MATGVFAQDDGAFYAEMKTFGEVGEIGASWQNGKNCGSCTLVAMERHKKSPCPWEKSSSTRYY